jgi:ring-1,2-phenylacetyl-CoA epoxidase subunit PaaE
MEVSACSVLIAAGSGITPRIAMLRYIEDRALDVPVTLIYCVRTSQDIIFQEELTRLSGSLARLRLIITLSAPDAGWKGNKGRLNKDLLLERILDFSGPTFFLCGPGSFMQHASELLKEQGVSADRIKQVSFGGKASLAVPDPSGDSSVPFVKFLRSGFQFELLPDMTLLEFAETVGVSLPYGLPAGTVRNLCNPPVARPCDHASGRRTERRTETGRIYSSVCQQNSRFHMYRRLMSL